MPITPKNKEIEQLKKENARLMAALSESEYECQRLEIINSNLQRQLEESNRELEKNIEVLQSFKSDIENLVDNLKSAK
jgi:conjugal transfer/entry exclusion protein